MQRRLISEVGRAEFDKAFQREMALAMKMADAQARDMQAAVERVRMGGVPAGIGGFR